MVDARYPSRGFVQLMEMLNSLNKAHPSSVQLLFATHPMSDERLQSALQRESSEYAYSKSFNEGREQFMDRTASLRAKKQGIELLQEGEKQMDAKAYDKAQDSFEDAIRKMPEDYTAHILMSKVLLLRNDPVRSAQYAKRAQEIYPSEAQSNFIGGIAGLGQKNYDQAYQNFSRYDKQLPGNPQIDFYRGYCLDKKGQKTSAAQLYMGFLKETNYQPNTYSKYAYGRLKQWGYAN